jgi:hypothetical protein
MPAFSRIHVLAICLGAAAAGACGNDPPITLRYKLTQGAAQKCPASCESVTVRCDSVLSIRVVDPKDPNDPKNVYASTCERLHDVHSLCDIRGVQLPEGVRVPLRRLAVQVALYNADEIPVSSDGTLLCPADQPFDANHFAAPGPYQPAVAGVGFYSPGDSETMVELGCADLPVVNTPTCRGDDKIKVTASVDDFDTGIYLSEGQANMVSLAVGEPFSRINPETQVTEYAMPMPTTSRLPRAGTTLPAAWNAEVSVRFKEAACVEVLEDASQATKSLSCKRVAPNDTSVDLRGLRLGRNTLNQVLATMGKVGFPPEGLVIGKVVNAQGAPAENVSVTPSVGTVQYLGPNGDKLVGSATSKTGIFISRDAPFNTLWAAAGTSGAYGGLVIDRVTVVILQPDASL